MTRYCWDFFGPSGEGTARHFHEHLDEFLGRERVDGCVTGVLVEPGRATVFCDTPAAHREVVTRALRPKRATEG